MISRFSHHSLNYESVVLFGKGSLISNTEEKLHALKSVSDHLIPGRWEEVRQPSAMELKATKVIAIPLEEATAKIRTGGPCGRQSILRARHLGGGTSRSGKIRKPYSR